MSNPLFFLNTFSGSLTLTFILLVATLRSARKTFDTSDTSKEFGPVRIEFGKVQSKVSLKYDSWHKDVLSKFGNMLGNEMQEFHSNVSKVSCSSKNRKLHFEVVL